MNAAAAIAAAAHRALLLEVATWPKPGLVSHVDPGSHQDMDAHLFRRSADAIVPFLGALVEAGGQARDLPALRAIGLSAEGAMLRATGGVNTHRGAIWGLGLLCAAAGLAGPDGVPTPSLGALVAQCWGGAIRSEPGPADSHGGAMRRRYGAGGARIEAASGFPSLYWIGLPALRLGRRLARGDEEAARVQCCFALIASVEDTNLLHRGGVGGAGLARRLAHGFLAAGGVSQPHWRERAARVHAQFVSRRLSPGGCADLLAMTLFVDQIARGSLRR